MIKKIILLTLILNISITSTASEISQLYDFFSDESHQKVPPAQITSFEAVRQIFKAEEEALTAILTGENRTEGSRHIFKQYKVKGGFHQVLTKENACALEKYLQFQQRRKQNAILKIEVYIKIWNQVKEEEDFKNIP